MVKREMNAQQVPALVPVHHPRIRSRMMYHIMRLPGATKYPLLEERTCQRLYLAADTLVRLYGFGYKLLVWDAYRPLLTQHAIYHALTSEIRSRHPDLTEPEIEKKAREFVNPPTGTPPHACGGAIDLTLLINGREAGMGTGFDAFVPAAASDYYERNLCRSTAELDAKNNRQILRQAMEHAGFVGIASEWWHWEYGTRHWASITGNKAIMTTVLACDSAR